MLPPPMSLPKGGGAIRGIGEKFTANPVTGTGSASVPIAMSPGRAGGRPQHDLDYDSGGGNGVFGLGWGIGVPSISRRTDRGLPRYRDEDESDTFVFAGAEDLVPWIETGTRRAAPVPTRLGGVDYLVHRYVPRIEGGFARIERWDAVHDREDVSWRTISRDNTTTWYGRTPDSRIADPDDPARIFRWLVSVAYDDKGEVTVYSYLPETADGVDTSAAWEANRVARAAGPNRYLKRIRYGNRSPYLPTLDPEQPEAELPDAWMFEVVLDYGDHLGDFPGPAADRPWPVRPDPFSDHRPGFEVRTYRRCERVLMFHHFPEDPDVGDGCLVRSTDLTYRDIAGRMDDPGTPGYSTITAVQQWSHAKDEQGTFHRRHQPPVTFRYSEPRVGDTVVTLRDEQLENLPVGTTGTGYRWVDLDGEGLSGVLVEQAGAWYYKANRGGGDFAPLRRLATRPSLASSETASAGRRQLVDLAGDGTVDLVDFGGPTPGFHEREHGRGDGDRDGGWNGFVPFASLPTVDWDDPNLRLVDLTGDGHADALLTEDERFTWYPSLTTRGFAASKAVRQPSDEDTGPRLMFADGIQTVFLADMCGDGLTDLVRIRNGEVCYWPSLGYGRFGRKVTLGNAPRFDAPDLYDPRRLRLADLDGSGPVDLVYLGRGGVQLYFNRSGNQLSDALEVDAPVATENLDAVQVADLLGNGTACLVWNSHLPADAGRSVRYLDLFGERPHLLVETDNNLGAVTSVEYTPSTRYYLDDLREGRPWITRLPFPVHCVSKVTVRDKWRQTAFSSSYSYHHGYFDGAEREFRGFGRVEQIDVEDYGTFGRGSAASPFITDDLTLYQPPVKTVTWYHTGAPDDERVLGQFSDEYFPSVFDVRGAFLEKPLLEPELPADLDAGERREAFRACKGMVLRQEVYELSVDSLEADPPRHTPVRLFSVATHTCAIRCLQPRGDNAHAVFLVTEAEGLTYQHDLALTEGGPVTPDPRVTHSLRLRHDEHGNLQQGVVVNYPRIGTGRPPGLPADPPRDGLVAAVQAELHVAYTETRYTDDVIIRAAAAAGAEGAVRHHRLRQPCEVRTYELTKLTAMQAPGGGPYADLQALRRHQLCEDATYPATVPAGQAPVAVTALAYHEQPVSGGAHRRIVERVRTLYFDDGDGVQAPVAPLDFGTHGPRGLKYEVYKLALTDELLDAAFWRRDASGQPVEDLLAWSVDGATTARDLLDDAAASGYVTGATLDASLAGQYWMRSGIARFAADAAANFYVPSRFTDAFGNTTTVEHDPTGLLPIASRDALGNETRLERLDYRMLAPRMLVDVNGNRAEVAFDIRGHVVAVASKGKQVGGAWQGDDLASLDFASTNPPVEEVVAFCSRSDADMAKARQWLGDASTRFVYHFGEALDAQGDPVWASSMAGACGISRERHAGQLPAGTVSPLQLQLECSDGTGAVLMRKAQAEPDPGLVAAGAAAPLRWIVNGLTVHNNKGKPVKQYEPAFSDRFGFEPPAAEGVTGVTYYDAAGRVVRTESPDGTLSRVEFSPWHVTSFDQNDAVLESTWYQTRNQYPPAGGLPVSPAGIVTATADQRAGWLTARHAGTPSVTVLDSLGRDVVSIAHNRVEDPGGPLTFGGRQWSDEFAVSYTKLDTEGKALWVRDALGNLVEQHVIPVKPARLADPANGPAPEAVPAGSAPCYDIAGNLLFTHSMDSGDRWTLADATGKQMLTWDVNDREPVAGPAWPAVTEQRLLYTRYDTLHRPAERWLRIDGGQRALVEAFEYRDTAGLSPATLADSRRRNLVGQAVTHWDPSGRATVERVSFDGETEAVTRTLVDDPRLGVVDWNVADRGALLAGETFEHAVEHDALGRPTTILNWHRGPGSRVAVYEPRYNERGLLAGEDLVLGATRTATATGRSGGTRTTVIRSATYNAKDQRLTVALDNGTTTRYAYDPDTLRLVQLYTRRGGAGFAGDCAGDPDAARPARPCGVQNLHYTYDPVGNVTHVQDDAQDTIWFASQQVEPSNDYTYDALYRLTEAAGRENAAGIGAPEQRERPWPQVAFPSPAATRRYTQRYAYDMVGNLLTMRHVAAALPGQPGAGSWTRNYAYDYQDPTRPASNRLYRTWLGTASWDGTAPADRTGYRHDAHGNLRNVASTPAGQDLRWDWRDVLRSLDLQGGGRAFYDYDVDAERTRKRIERNGGDVEERIQLDGFEWYRRWVGGAVVEEIETLHLFEGERRVLLVDDVRRAPPGSAGVRTLFRYQYGDHAASVSTELDETAQVISHEEYHPYGTSAYRAANSAVEAPEKRYRYAGMERDDESGLNRHGARYLSCALGRWLSADPVGIADGLNRYRYARCNPVANGDPGGTQTVGTVRGIAAVRRRDADEKQRILNHMAHHPEQYPTVTEETKEAMRAEVRALNLEAGKLEAEAGEREDFHRNVGLPVVGAAAAIAAAPAEAVTATVLVVGAGLGALFSFGRQVAEKIDGTRTELSGMDVLSGAGWGGALAPATIAYAPVRVAMVVSGVASGSSELDKGHTVTGWYDIATSVVPEVISRAKGGKLKPGDLAARLNPKNYSIDPNTLGTPGLNIEFKPPAAPKPKGSRINLLGKGVKERRLALGLRGGGVLAALAKKMKATTFWSFDKTRTEFAAVKEILARISFLMGAADKIYFDLTGMFGRKHPYYKTLADVVADPMNIPNWEAYQIATDTGAVDPKGIPLKEKTWFTHTDYTEGGKKVVTKGKLEKFMP